MVRYVDWNGRGVGGRRQEIEKLVEEMIERDGTE